MQDREPTYVILHDIDMSFLNIVFFTLKWFVATIPAVVIMMLFWGALMYFMTAIGLFPTPPAY